MKANLALLIDLYAKFLQVLDYDDQAQADQVRSEISALLAQLVVFML